MSELVEPMRRNAVVVLKDGSIARRNVDGPEPLPGSGGCWTHYPARPITTGPSHMDAVDPGWTVSWDQLAVEKVIHVTRLEKVEEANRGADTV